MLPWKNQRTLTYPTALVDITSPSLASSVHLRKANHLPKLRLNALPRLFGATTPGCQSFWLNGKEIKKTGPLRDTSRIIFGTRHGIILKNLLPHGALMF